MKIIVTHTSCDLDGIVSIWLIKRFLPGWEDAQLEFVPAGEKLSGRYEEKGEVIEKVNGNEVIHADTGFGKLDHHDTSDQNVCGAKLTFDFVKNKPALSQNETKQEAVKRMVEIVVDTDHFQEVFYKDPLADFHDFSLDGILEGVRLEYYHNDERIAEFIMSCLDAILHTFENRIWAEKEIKEKGIEFDTKWGKGLGIETLNDEVLKLGQMMGYAVVVRKDPKSGFARIKARPNNRDQKSTLRFRPSTSSSLSLGVEDLSSGPKGSGREIKNQKDNIDLTSVCEQLKKIDPNATWFLHISKRMLLNGSSKNPKMRGTTLSLREIIEVLKSHH